MKKIILSIALACLVSIIFIPLVAGAQAQGGQKGLVNCDPAAGQECGIKEFFAAIVGIYNFIVFKIATPLATLALIIGGVLMMISAGNPNLMGTGKKIFYSAIIGLVLALCSYLIVDFILTTIGFKGDWKNPFGG